MKKSANKARLVPTFCRIFLLTLLLFISSVGVALAQTFSFNKQNTTIESVLKAVEKSSRYTFIYYDNQVDVNKRVNINVKNVPIEKLMDALLFNTGYSYQIRKNQILISAANDSQKEGKNGQTTRIVKGVVVDKQDQPIVGANVVELQNPTNGAVTDVDGRFSIKMFNGSSELQVSFIGFLSSTVKPVDNNLKIILNDDQKALEELVVVGYAVQRKSDLTGAVGSVKFKQLEKQPVVRIDQALQGRVSGLQVTTINGAPGSGTTIRIRGGNSINGDNEPLYVIDGIIGGGDLNSINPSDIESIEVLKDASSTAIYGSRGANGVVLITTKMGGKEQGVRLNYNGYYGIQEVAKYVDFLTGPEYVSWKNENERYFGRPDMYSTKDVPNTDWQKLMYRKAAITEHNLSLTKGYKDGSYFFSLNYLNQDGVMKKTNFTRYQIRFNLEQNIGSYIKAGAVLSTAYTVTDNPVMDAFGIMQLPNMPVYDSDGNFSTLNPSTGNVINTVAAQKEYIQSVTNRSRQYGNVYAQLMPLEGMVFKSSFGFDISSQKYNYYESVKLPTNVSSNAGGRATINTLFPISYQNENTLSYLKEFNKHRINLLAGWTVQRYQSEFLNSSASGFPNDVNLYHSIESGNPKTKNIQSGESRWSLLSGLFRINYTYNDRYLITISGRSDGSSRLAKGKQWAFFPSAALAWRLSEERFIKDLNLFSNLKIRASYGRSGSQAVDPYSTFDKLTAGQTIFGNSQFTFFQKASISNKNLTWEKTDQLDLGLNIGLLNSRINVELDWYYKKTRDLLLFKEPAFQTGYSSILENIGSVENRGFELSVSTTNFKGNDLIWESLLTLSTNKSRVVSLGGKSFLDNGEGARLIVGKPVGTFFGIRYQGTWKEGEIPTGSKWVPGDPKMLDVDGNGVFTVADGVVIGDSEPLFYGGFSNTVSYKNWVLNLFFDFSYGNDIYDLSANAAFGGYNTNLYGVNRDRWTPENPQSDIPRAGSGFKYIYDSYAGNKGGSSLFIYDGSFLRLKNLNIEYRIPQKSKVVKSMSAYASVANLLTFTSYSGYSPDVNVAGTNSTRRGFDNNAYPQSRIYTLGLKLDF